MASSKRKRNSTRHKPAKRPKYIDSSAHDAQTQTQPTQADDFCPVECILDEKIERGRTVYKLQWQGVNPETGKPWDPTWEPRSNCTELLLASWEVEKIAKGRTGSATKKSGRGSGRDRRKSRGGHQQQPPAQRTLQLSRKAQSSPSASTTHSTSLESVPSTPARGCIAREGTLASSAATSPTGAGASATPRASPRIAILRRGSSFDAEEYERYSQLAASQSQFSSTQSHTEHTDLDSSQLFAATRAQSYQYSSGIVPDSQESTGEATFLPPTQHSEGSVQQSTATTSRSQEVEEEEEDSGLLEIIQQDTRDISPARSIAETIPDSNTAVDSQNQESRNNTEDLIELTQSNSQTQFPIVISSAEATSESQSQEVQGESQDGNVQTAGQTLRQREDVQEQAQEEDYYRSGEHSALLNGQEDDLQFSQHALEEQLNDEELARQQDREKCTSFPVGIAPGPGPSLDTQEDEVSIADDANQSVIQVPHTQTHDKPRHPSGAELHSGTTEPSDQTVPQRSSIPTSLATVPEQAVNEENAQFPFQSQHPSNYSGIAQESPKGISDQVPDSGVVGTTWTEASASAAPSPRQVNALGTATREPTIEPTLSHVQPYHPSLKTLHPVSHAQERLQLSYILQQPVRHTSPDIAQAQSRRGEPNNTPWQPSQPFQSVLDTVLRRDFACESQPPTSTGRSTDSREQNAQVVPLEVDLSTQDAITESIQTTIEDEPAKERESSESRHDSSQDSPEQPGSPDRSSSPIPDPPSFSLATVASKPPSRPVSPIPTSSWSIMSGESVSEAVRREMQERLAEKNQASPFVPRRHRNKANSDQSAAVPLAASVAARRLLGENASSVANDGTRSPSAVPDHAPVPPGPTSLSAVVTASSNDLLNTAFKDTEMETVSEGLPQIVEIDATTAADVEHSLEDFADPNLENEDDAQFSDADDENSGSLLHDDLQLEPEEYIVPLFIEGRQLDMYNAHIQQQIELLEQFLKDPRGFTSLSKMEAILNYLRAIETHMDMVFAEAESSSRNETATQVEFTAQFGMENSSKFRFLHTLFHRLRDHDKHVVLVLETDNDALFHILEMFCKAKYVNFDIPTKGRHSDPMFTEGAMLVTIIPSNSSPVIRAPDVIICLDGVQEAAKIRQNNWATSPIHEIVPVLHLVIPRTVGHIERYVSQSLSRVDQMHTTVAGLAQITRSAEIGKPIDEATERAPVVAEMVVDWLTGGNDEDGWPLPSIGSIKDVIEYQTQVSPSQASTTPSAPERNKRPLDDEEFDSAKRMRPTPQPNNTSINNNDQEVSHVSDSVPGTAGEQSGDVLISKLRRQLARTEEALQDALTARKEDQEKYQMWERQLTVHEDLRREYRTLIGDKQALEAKLETKTKALETKSESLSTRTAEVNDLKRRLEEQRATDALSPDAKTAKITQLRQELEDKEVERNRALNGARSADSTLEFSQQQRRIAEDLLSAAQAKNDQLTDENQKLTHQASGHLEKVKALHLDRHARNLEHQNQSLRNEIAIYKKAVAQKDDELMRLKNGRQGVGTRGQSLTPQPKIRSRAGSPMGGRVSNLRKE
ncbi:hypothetical protein T440DRAFT_467301 [Plenodomus tracheiphilus IPT5]|uniref:Chromo domain-containing protein n=1 Tax=Plenodomus tracheiphilus IPT5 TaxID=1408161 RepID=A0A6A7B9N7_9PLEO|nr:hypothetical protein T440DRAFT_467301 [Plenodomus tracheiphilus IPT5]